MTEREALNLALKALKLEDMACRYEKEPTPEHIAKAITAIKEALAQSEHELVATWENKYGMKEWEVHALRAGWSLTPSQRTWIGLTEEEKQGAVWTDGEFGDGMLWAEKLLKERNT